MTLYQRYLAVLADIEAERRATPDGTYWAARLDQKKLDFVQAMTERFGGTDEKEKV